LLLPELRTAACLCLKRLHFRQEAKILGPEKTKADGSMGGNAFRFVLNNRKETQHNEEEEKSSVRRKRGRKIASCVQSASWVGKERVGLLDDEEGGKGTSELRGPVYYATGEMPDRLDMNAVVANQKAVGFEWGKRKVLRQSPARTAQERGGGTKDLGKMGWENATVVESPGTALGS